MSRPQPRSYKRSRDEVLAALKEHNLDLALFAADKSFGLFAGKLEDPNAEWTTFQESALTRAMALDDLSATVVANLYALLKEGF